MKKEHRFFDYLLILTFLIGLFLPLVFTNNRTKSMIEKRKLAPFPMWKWERRTIINFPTKFQEFFNDHFGFRDYLTRWYNLLAIMLGSSPKSKIMVGKEGWFFWGETPDNIEDYRKNDPLTPQQLFRWKATLEVKYRYLKQQGIHYLLVIPPEKHSIYGEYYPSRIRRVGRQSRLDQFMEYMNDSEVPILDLRQAFIETKPEGQLFYKTDTHWNSFGAAIAQYEIMQYLATLYPTIRPIQYRVQDFSWNSGKGGDIAEMLNLADILKEKITPRLRHPIEECEKKTLDDKIAPTYIPPFMTNCNSSAPIMLMFQDSMFMALQPYISQYFSKSIYVWKTVDFESLPKFVKQYRPDIIIEEEVERGLRGIPKLPSLTSEIYQALAHHYQDTQHVQPTDVHEKLTLYFFPHSNSAESFMLLTK